MTHQLSKRRLILISGPQAQALSAAEQLIQRSGLEKDSIYRWQPDATAQSELGRDFSVVLINAYQGLNPDSIGRLSGTVIAGGALIIVCPELSQWADYTDPERNKLLSYATDINAVGKGYVSRWVCLLKKMDGPAKLNFDEVQSIAAIKPCRIHLPAGHSITVDQQAAVEAICKAATAKRKRPAIITASRGRGKSSALGLAAGGLIRTQHCRNIIVTSSGSGQLKSLFKNAQAALPGSRINADGKSIQHPNGSLRYVAVDSLIAQTTDCDLLLVDEAASLGVSRLLHLLKAYPRLAFSTTEHGYEGSGRGFSLKFKQLVQAHCRGAYLVSLTKPIRWRNHDPLEAWINQLLLLDAVTPAICPPADINFSKLEFKLISRETLANDEDLLRRVFALLVDAHYQTRPVDLRYLLDAPKAQLWAAHQYGDPIGLVWLVMEGGLDSTIAREIVSGTRRPQGHLAPQILAAHLGLEKAITLHCARIQRIVVHPDLQNRGLGSWMLNAIKSCMQLETDYLASSFGADLLLSRFWIRAGYQAVRLSDQAHAASGLRSALVIEPLSKQAKAMTSEATRIFLDQLVCQLADSLKQQSAPLILTLASSPSWLPSPLSSLASIPIPKPCQSITDDNFKAACLFAYAQRPYESCLPALRYLARQLLSSAPLQSKLGASQASLYITRILQHQYWDRCAALAGLSGKKGCLRSLRKSSQMILEHLYPDASINAIRTLYSPVEGQPVTPAS